MKITTFALSALLISGCAAGKILPETERKAQFTHTSKAKKTEAYEKALAYFSKNLGNSNSAIKMRSKKSGTIITKGNISCDVLRQAGDINMYSASFNLTFKAKDNKVRYKYDNVKMIGDSGKELGWAYLQITSKDNLKKVNTCLSELSQKITNEINQRDDF